MGQLLHESVRSIVLGLLHKNFLPTFLKKTHQAMSQLLNLKLRIF